MLIYFKRGEKKTTGFKLSELHHFYTGGLMAIICFWFGFEVYLPQWLADVIFYAGCTFSWIAVDDMIQHYVQGRQLRKIGYYDLYSFWNWFPRMVLRQWKK